MSVSVVDPLGRGWNRARTLLLEPFSLERWLILGFSAWLAGLLDGHTGSASWEMGGGDAGMESLGSGLGNLLTGAIAVLALLLLVGGLVLAVVFLWVSSRGKFVFLDNVITGETRIAEPWGRLGALGDSLFWFRLVLTAVLVALVLGMILPVLLAAAVPDSPPWEHLGVAAVVYVVAVILLLAFAFGLTSLFLNDFVVPIMYRHGVGVMEGWRRFLPLLRENTGEFILYALFVFVLGMALTAALLFVGLATCCVGFVLIALPYVGTVVTLPVWVTYRAYSLEFLAQFDEELRLLPAS